MKNPTLDEFLASRTPKNAYIQYPGFKDLYVRKNDVFVRFDEKTYVCRNVVQIANVSAKKPGHGAFKALIKDLVSRGKAIYVECVHTEWFRDKLLEWGFVRVNLLEGDHFLYNYTGLLDDGKKTASEPTQIQTDRPEGS